MYLRSALASSAVILGLLCLVSVASASRESFQAPRKLAQNSAYNCDADIAHSPFRVRASSVTVVNSQTNRVCFSVSPVGCKSGGCCSKALQKLRLLSGPKCGRSTVKSADSKVSLSWGTQGDIGLPIVDITPSRKLSVGESLEFCLLLSAPCKTLESFCGIQGSCGYQLFSGSKCCAIDSLPVLTATAAPSKPTTPTPAPKPSPPAPKPTWPPVRPIDSQQTCFEPRAPVLYTFVLQQWATWYQRDNNPVWRYEDRTNTSQIEQLFNIWSSIVEATDPKREGLLFGLPDGGALVFDSPYSVSCYLNQTLNKITQPLPLAPRRTLVSYKVVTAGDTSTCVVNTEKTPAELLFNVDVSQLLVYVLNYYYNIFPEAQPVAQANGGSISTFVFGPSMRPSCRCKSGKELLDIVNKVVSSSSSDVEAPKDFAACAADIASAYQDGFYNPMICNDVPELCPSGGGPVRICSGSCTSADSPVTSSSSTLAEAATPDSPPSLSGDALAPAPIEPDGCYTDWYKPVFTYSINDWADTTGAAPLQFLTRYWFDLAQLSKGQNMPGRDQPALLFGMKKNGQNLYFDTPASVACYLKAVLNNSAKGLKGLSAPLKTTTKGTLIHYTIDDSYNCQTNIADIPLYDEDVAQMLVFELNYFYNFLRPQTVLVSSGQSVDSLITGRNMRPSCAQYSFAQLESLAMAIVTDYSNSRVTYTSLSECFQDIANQYQRGLFNKNVCKTKPDGSGCEPGTGKVQLCNTAYYSVQNVPELNLPVDDLNAEPLPGDVSDPCVTNSPRPLGALTLANWVNDWAPGGKFTFLLDSDTTQYWGPMTGQSNMFYLGEQNSGRRIKFDSPMAINCFLKKNNQTGGMLTLSGIGSLTVTGWGSLAQNSCNNAWFSDVRGDNDLVRELLVCKLHFFYNLFANPHQKVLNEASGGRTINDLYWSKDTAAPWSGLPVNISMTDLVDQAVSSGNVDQMNTVATVCRSFSRNYDASAIGVSAADEGATDDERQIGIFPGEEGQDVSDDPNGDGSQEVPKETDSTADAPPSPTPPPPIVVADGPGFVLDPDNEVNHGTEEVQNVSNDAAGGDTESAGDNGGDETATVNSVAAPAPVSQQSNGGAVVSMALVVGKYNNGVLEVQECLEGTASGGKR